jgi:hypothetical protein
MREGVSRWEWSSSSIGKGRGRKEKVVRRRPCRMVASWQRSWDARDENPFDAGDNESHRARARKRQKHVNERLIKEDVNHYEKENN